MRTETGEMRAAAVCLALIGAYMAAVLASGQVPFDQFQQLLVVYVQSMIALTLIAGTTALFVICGRRRIQEKRLPSPFELIGLFVMERWQRDRLFSLLAPPLVCALTLASFNAFKQLILPSAGFGLDPLFADWDRALFLGVDPWVVTHQLFGSLTATRLIDGFYHAWFVPMTLGISICVFLKNPELRIQYLLAYILSFILIGSLLAYLLPSAGPCFYDRFAGTSETFSALMERLRAHDAALLASGDAGLAALRNQGALLGHFNTGQLALGGGISAMPSMHNALAVLFALGGMRLGRGFGLAMWVYALLIWIGSIHLGWHYALDGIVAALLALGLWKVSGHLARMLLNNDAFMRPVSVAAE